MRRRRNPFSTGSGPFGGAPGRFDSTPIRRPRTRWVGRFLVVLIVLAAMGVGIAVIVNSSTDYATSGPPAPVPPPQPRPFAPAVIPGWVAVTDAKATIAYDVPADWHVSYLGDGITLSTKDGRLPVTMMASYLDGYCESATSSFRAESGAATVPDADATSAATTTARDVADAVYGVGTAPTVTLGPPTTFTLHGRTGTLVTANVTVHSTDRCEPPSALVDVYALPDPAHNESLVVIAYADQRFTGAVSQPNLDRIVTSIRPLAAH
jgi:hypothetical protein